MSTTAEISTEYLNALLQESAELTTAKLNYTGMTEYKDTGVAVLNRGDFIMVYEATARIGIDLSKATVTEIDHDNRVIYLSVPQAEVQEVHVNADTIKYFDEDFSLFNFDKKADANKAIALAEESAKQEIMQMGVIEYANENARALLSSLLSQTLPQYEVKPD